MSLQDFRQSTGNEAALLAGIRVLDLATRRGELAGRLLADLGAEVLKVEPPEGIDSRMIPPFDERSPDHVSLYWAAVGTGKHSIVLDLAREADRECLLQLVRRADVFIESFDPGAMAANALGYADLSRLNPALIYASITPFGQAGPKSRWPATELTLEAAGGRVGLQGDRDRPPLPVGYPQAAFHAGARAAADIVIALNERAISGLGQHLDTSMQEAIVYTLLASAGYPANTGGDPPGSGDDRAEAAAARGAILGRCDCADGHVIVTATSNVQLMRVIPSMVLPTLIERGECPPALLGVDWEQMAQAAREAGDQTETLATAFEAVRSFFRLKTKRELMAWAWANDIHLGPANTTRDLLENPQLRARGYWQGIGRDTRPGLAVHPSRSTLRPDSRAPGLGVDQSRIEDWLASAPAQPVDEKDRPARLGEAFAGLKVADFSWVAVGPITAKAFADHGATVVRVESATRIDYVRTLLPFKDGRPGINRGHWVNNLNTSKLGIALNLAKPGGRELARRLADWADVIVENFTPGTMKRLGLDYDTLSRDRRDLIMISTSLMGQTGPWASFAGYGPHGAAISGLHAITGWPDRPACGPSGPYTDVIAPHYAISALAAAVLERRRSGLGQHIDVSQVEAAVHFIEPLVLDEIVNGRTASAAGLHSATACPSGVYPTRGRERYIAISVETPVQWRALRALGPFDGFDDRRYDSLSERRAVDGAMEDRLRTWTATFDGPELEQRLVDAGVPASVVQRMTGLAQDPQLASRGYFVTLAQSEVGPLPYDGLMTHFSAKQEMLHKPAPSLGEDTEKVLTQLLGLSAAEIATYAVDEVFT